MRYRLEELFDLQMGKTPTRANLEYWNGTNKWVSISDLSSYDKYVTDTNECISDLGVSESGIKVVPKNTVIMSFKLSIGKTAITTEEVYTNEAIMAFIDKGICEINTDYLYYLFSGTDWNKGTNKAVLGLTLNKATLSKKEIDIPDLHTQNEVVKKLDALSNVIQLQKHSLDKLDELIKSRFVEMFGMVDHSKYPKYAMTDLCEIIDGDRGKNYPKQDEFSENGYCLFLNAKNVTSKGFDFSQCMFITQQKDDQLRKGKLKRGDVVLTTRGTIGNLAYFSKDIPFEHMRINSGMVILRMKKESINEVFFIEHFKIILSDILQTVASGTAQPQLPINTMKNIKLITPPLDLQNKFADFVTQVEKQKATVQQSIDKLETLKKSLMQEYFG